MAGQNQAQNVDLFDTYFRKADLDQDGRISGAEAVAFFQGSNLPKQVLAQIWMHADQNRTGYLGRTEFYNALKLVTVAQSKRELTPDIVKAALYGPAAAKIPAPQINIPATSPTQPSSIAAAPAPQMGALAPTSSQNPGFRGPQLYPNATMNPQFRPSQDNQFMRPPQVMPVGAALLPSQGIPGGGSVAGPRPPNSNVSTDWFGGRTGGSPMGATSQTPSRGTSPTVGQDGFGLPSSGLSSSMPPRPLANSGIIPSVTSKPQDQVFSSFQSTAKDSKALVVSGNGFASNSIFGGDVFSASQPKQNTAAPSFSAGSAAISSAIVPVPSGPQPSVKQDPFDTLGSLSTQTAGGQLQQPPSLVKPNQQVSTQSAAAFSSSDSLMGPGNSAPSQSQPSWPKMTQSNIQKYTKVFVEVDTDRDGKITGEQARNLFLSWRLPREVLKQVWDLSDQDNDSMLSLREFCTALYLMERYREGRPLPPVLPSSVMYDETLLRTTGSAGPAAGYGHAAWRPTPGLQQPGMPGARPILPAASARPPMQVPFSPQADGVMRQPNQQKSRVPVLEKHLLNQLSKEENASLNSEFREAADADKKVEELVEIMGYKEKIEFHRNKMQELVLYKSRCDNRLNEITERASADKREVEELAKKYEEKYKQVGDVASKLTIEEATFRDVQERKMELYQAIVKMEQGGSADGILQVRADRIQSDLEELVKALNERCKKYGLPVKPTGLIELPLGWQPGIEEGAADWDEDWDKFEDEGFTFVQELTLDAQNTVAPPKPKSASVWKEKASSDEGLTTSSPNADTKSEKPTSTVDWNTEGGSVYAHSDDGSARSAPASPTGRSTVESPSQDFGDNHFVKNIGADASPRAKETHNDHDDAESVLSVDKSFDEPTWGGTFDANDDTDSVWGFNTSHTKDLDQESHRDSFFPDLGLNPIKTESPQAGSMFQKKSLFNFDDSVPSSPLFNSGYSPRYNEGSVDHSFDNLSRFDSFSMHDSGFFPPRETLARFDSIRSTADSTYSRDFPSFDDTDPFGSSGPFKSSSENQTPRSSDNWSAF
ncbi:LOW QUALITY PROTEIN: epidermal growth factor receptor substrate 15-like 1 [Telopea speciosissima]|uniref:LOW QUALITY PROTEIN: epidermal growth factor receptor substrate 15-like 1 n=1 Tax=Telopea speciosissima TaxID=54955 RepID=UPI001CC59E4F|nr:LOW QUALITY PROTEIN: epidermal growth factor receptor substrate 15-like 1 [Telopea speciosissima]